jgi:hypothetical protein
LGVRLQPTAADEALKMANSSARDDFSFINACIGFSSIAILRRELIELFLQFWIDDVISGSKCRF